MDGLDAAIFLFFFNITIGERLCEFPSLCTADKISVNMTFNLTIYSQLIVFSHNSLILCFFLKKKKYICSGYYRQRSVRFDVIIYKYRWLVPSVQIVGVGPPESPAGIFLLFIWLLKLCLLGCWRRQKRARYAVGISRIFPYKNSKVNTVQYSKSSIVYCIHYIILLIRTYFRITLLFKAYLHVF